MPLAVITGGTQGLGRALVAALTGRGWHVVTDARDVSPLSGVQNVTALAGDVTDPIHRAALIAAAKNEPIDLLVNNASRLGPSPQPSLATYPLDEFRRVYETDVVAPLALIQQALPALGAKATIVNVSSDAAVEAYETWGGYGSAKAALDQLTRVLAAERPDLAVYAFDPGDMRTAMHQAAYPGEDISDRPAPEERAVPAFLRLLDERPRSSRYRADDLLPAGVA